MQFTVQANFSFVLFFSVLLISSRCIKDCKYFHNSRECSCSPYSLFYIYFCINMMMKWTFLWWISVCLKWWGDVEIDSCVSRILHAPKGSLVSFLLRFTYWIFTWHIAFWGVFHFSFITIYNFNNSLLLASDDLSPIFLNLESSF